MRPHSSMPLEEWEEKLVPGQEVSMRWLCFTVKIENKTFATIGDFQVESLTHRLQQHFRCRPLNAAAGTPASLEPRPRPQGRLLIKAHQQGAAARRAEGAGTCCLPSPFLQPTLPAPPFPRPPPPAGAGPQHGAHRRHAGARGHHAAGGDRHPAARHARQWLPVRPRRLRSRPPLPWLRPRRFPRPRPRRLCAPAGRAAEYPARRRAGM